MHSLVKHLIVLEVVEQRRGHESAEVDRNTDVPRTRWTDAAVDLMNTGSGSADSCKPLAHQLRGPWPRW